MTIIKQSYLMKKISIQAGEIRLEAELYDTPTAQTIYDALPIAAQIHTWGKEIYFSVDIKLSLENDAREEVNEGELAYWPAGPAFCIFFGPTPASTGNKPKAFSPVNVFGKIGLNFKILGNIRNGTQIVVEKA